MHKNDIIAEVDRLPCSHPASVNVDVANTYYSLAKMLRPKLVVEIGCFIPKRSQEALADVGGVKFDLLVIDSLHDYETCVWEVINYEPQLKNGGYLILHDSVYFAGVQAVVQRLHENPRFEVVTLPTPRRHGSTRSNFPGLTLVRKLSSDGANISYNKHYERGVIYPSRKRQELGKMPVFNASEGIFYIPDSPRGEMTLRFEKQIRPPDDLAEACFIETDEACSANATGFYLSQLVYVEYFEGDTAIIRGYFSAYLTMRKGPGNKTLWEFESLDEIDYDKEIEPVFFMYG